MSRPKASYPTPPRRHIRYIRWLERALEHEPTLGIHDRLDALCRISTLEAEYRARFDRQPVMRG